MTLQICPPKLPVFHNHIYIKKPGFESIFVSFHCLTIFIYRFRAEVLNPKSNLLHFIDYGNQSTTDLVKVIPDSLKNIPALAVRMVIYNKSSNLSEGDDLTISVRKQVKVNTVILFSKFIYVILYYYSMTMAPIWLK